MGKTRHTGNGNLKKELKKYLPFYMFLLPAIILVVLFCYMPMEGLVIAFKDYKMARGIEGSEWVGLKHFQALFSDPNFYRVADHVLEQADGCGEVVPALNHSFPVHIGGDHVRRLVGCVIVQVKHRVKSHAYQAADV